MKNKKVVIKEIRNTYSEENWQSQSLILGNIDKLIGSHQNQSRKKWGILYIRNEKAYIAIYAMENEKRKRIFSKLYANKFGILFEDKFLNNIGL